MSAVTGICAGVVCYLLLSTFGIGAADFKHALGIARDLLSGADPYAHEPGPYWIPYPLPAGLLALPFVKLPDAAVGGAFIGSSIGLLTWAILRSGETWRLAMLFSWPLLYAVLFAQWSPLLCAMWFIPELAPLALCKPNIALPFLATQKPRWIPIAIGAAIFAASLILKPDWPFAWLSQTRSYQGMTPPILFLPFGPLVLLNLFAWKERRAWLVLTMALMPQRVFYDQLPLLLAANSNRELFWLIIASWSSFFALWISPNLASMPGGWQIWILLAHYFPATLVIAWPHIRARVRMPAVAPRAHGTIDV